MGKIKKKLRKRTKRRVMKTEDIGFEKNEKRTRKQ